MAATYEPLELDPFGITIEFLRSGDDTGGELLEMDVIGRPRGFLSQRHVHPSQAERLGVISGAMKVTMNGREQLLTPGESVTVPAGTPHSQVPVGEDPGRVRIQVRPAGRTRQFLERLAEVCREGKVTRRGYPRPAAAAELILDFSDTGHATVPSLGLQRAVARAVGAATSSARPYVFVDEWDVAAPQEEVFAALSDSRTYPHWWTPIYRDVSAEGPPVVGRESRQKFKAKLPYTLTTVSKIVSLEPPNRFEVDVDGDLRGHGVWTLTPRDGVVHVRFDWQVHPDRTIIRVLTPILRPLFRWNHKVAIKAAMRGLEPYARRRGDDHADRG
jgi:quercetin dioxygenase-like cupin family protein/uncharacterized protein YndB with AHSA1/START domain